MLCGRHKGEFVLELTLECQLQIILLKNQDVELYHKKFNKSFCCKNKKNRAEINQMKTEG